MKFKLKTLLLSIAFVAFVLFALMNARHYWIRYYYAVTFLVLAAFLTRAILQTGPKRAFSVGFCVFGIGYSLLAFTPLFKAPFIRFVGVADTIMFGLHPFCEREISKDDAEKGGWIDRRSFSSTPNVSVPTIRDFRAMSQALYPLLLGICGGIIGGLCYKDKPESG